MTGIRLQKHRVGVIAMAALLLAGAASFTIVQHRTTAAGTSLQALADEAALAGVNALAATEGQTDAMRVEAANSAIHKVVAPRSDIKPIVSPSVDELKMSVTLATSHGGRGTAVFSTASYVRPGSAVSPGQTADAVIKKRIRG
jgi:hypothetical protein